MATALVAIFVSGYVQGSQASQGSEANEQHYKKYFTFLKEVLLNATKKRNGVIAGAALRDMLQSSYKPMQEYAEKYLKKRHGGQAAWRVIQQNINTNENFDFVVTFTQDFANANGDQRTATVTTTQSTQETKEKAHKQEQAAKLTAADIMTKDDQGYTKFMRAALSGDFATMQHYKDLGATLFKLDTIQGHVRVLFDENNQKEPITKLLEEQYHKTKDAKFDIILCILHTWASSELENYYLMQSSTSDKTLIINYNNCNSFDDVLSAIYLYARNISQVIFNPNFVAKTSIFSPQALQRIIQFHAGNWLLRSVLKHDIEGIKQALKYEEDINAAREIYDDNFRTYVLLNAYELATKLKNQELVGWLKQQGGRLPTGDDLMTYSRIYGNMMKHAPKEPQESKESKESKRRTG